MFSWFFWLRPAFTSMDGPAFAAREQGAAALLSIPEQVLYPYYAEQPRLIGFSALDDQAFGGIIWASGHIYLIPLLLQVAKILNHEERVRRRAEAIPGQPAAQPADQLDSERFTI